MVSGFQFGSAFGRQDKKSMHSNAAFANVTFDCPVALAKQHPYTHARLGFVVHSSEAESGTFDANGTPLSTYQPHTIEGLRTQTFAPDQFELPLTIRVKELQPNARIEITSIVLENL